MFSSPLVSLFVCLFVCSFVSKITQTLYTQPIFTKFGGKVAHEPLKKPLNFGGNSDDVKLISFRVRVGSVWLWFRLDGRSVSRNAEYVLCGFCLIVTILRYQSPWQRFALYCTILVFSLCLSVCLPARTKHATTKTKPVRNKLATNASTWLTDNMV